VKEKRRIILEGLLTKHEPWVDRGRIRKMLGGTRAEQSVQTLERQKQKALRQARNRTGV